MAELYSWVVSCKVLWPCSMRSTWIYNRSKESVRDRGKHRDSDRNDVEIEIEIKIETETATKIVIEIGIETDRDRNRGRDNHRLQRQVNGRDSNRWTDGHTSVKYISLYC